MTEKRQGEPEELHKKARTSSQKKFQSSTDWLRANGYTEEAEEERRRDRRNRLRLGMLLS